MFSGGHSFNVLYHNSMNLEQLNNRINASTSYEVNMNDVEADSSGETEAGTTQRDMAMRPVLI